MVCALYPSVGVMRNGDHETLTLLLHPFLQADAASSDSGTSARIAALEAAFADSRQTGAAAGAQLAAEQGEMDTHAGADAAVRGHPSAEGSGDVHRRAAGGADSHQLREALELAKQQQAAQVQSMIRSNCCPTRQPFQNCTTCWFLVTCLSMQCYV
jgi:hypothetical protein